MKITVSQLRRVIKEEITRIINETDETMESGAISSDQMKDAIRPSLENYVKLFGELSMLARTIKPELPQEQKDALNTEYARLSKEVRAIGKAIDWGNLSAIDKTELWSEVWKKKGELTPGYQIWYSSEPHSAYSGAGLDLKDFDEADRQRYHAEAEAKRMAGRGRTRRR